MTAHPQRAGPADAPWVLVTGAGHRLGRELALQFAGAGWNVVAHHRASAAAAQATCDAVVGRGRAAVAIGADLAQPDAATTLLDACRARTGAWPGCIVNSASRFEPDDARTLDAAALIGHFTVNCAAPLLLATALHAALERAEQVERAERAGQAKRTAPAPGSGSFQARPDGARPGDLPRPTTTPCVIQILDQKVHNLNPDYLSYTVSKLALERSVPLLAQALAPRVRVCGISPGLIYRSGPQTDANFDRASRVNLLRRPIEPAAVARTAVFVAGNDALNGCVIPVDNGQHLVPLERDVMWALDAAAGR